MNVFIRKATTNDTDALSKLFVEFMGTESDIIKMRTTIDKINNNPQYYVPVAVINNRIVGVAMGIACLDICGTCDPFLLIEDVVVDPEYRGKGVGRLLMESVEQFGRKNKCKYAILVSEPKRTGSHKFYEKIDYHHEMGFKKRLD